MDASRLEKRRTEALEEIRAAAWKQISEKGAAALSLRAIGRERKLAASAIYYYYKDRDALVTALLMDAFTAFGDALEAARDSRPAGDYAGRFRLMCKAYFTWAAQNPQRYALMFGTPIEGYLFARELGPVAQRSFLVLLGLIGRAHAAGKITGPWSTLRLPVPLRTRYESLKRQGMPHQHIDIHLALSVWTSMHGITSLYLYHYLSGFLQQDVEAFVDFEIDKLARLLGFASSEKNDANE